MAKHKVTPNVYNTNTSHHTCDTCGVEFMVTPEAKGNDFDNCLGTECPSYDQERDMDIVFMTDSEIANNGKPVSLRKLLQRKKFKETGEI